MGLPSSFLSSRPYLPAQSAPRVAPLPSLSPRLLPPLPQHRAPPPDTIPADPGCMDPAALNPTYPAPPRPYFTRRDATSRCRRRLAIEAWLGARSCRSTLPGRPCASASRQALAAALPQRRPPIKSLPHPPQLASPLLKHAGIRTKPLQFAKRPFHLLD